MYDLPQLIMVPFHAAMFSLLYYLFINRFLNRVAISRLAKSSFRLEIPDILDLTTAYIIASLACLYILFSNLKSDTDGSKYINILGIFAVDCDSKHMVVLISIIISILFIGRIITKVQGVSYGRLHFSSIFVASSLYMSYDIINSFIDSTHTPQILYVSLFNKINGFVDFFDPFKIHLFAGILFLALFCEMGLSLFPPTSKSISVVLDKFPSDLKVITGIYGAFIRYVNQKIVSFEDLSFHNGHEKYKKIIQKEYNSMNRLTDQDIDMWTNDSSNSIWDDDGIYSKLEGILCEKNEPYVFNWDAVPGVDEGILRRFLAKKIGQEWPNSLKFKKSEDSTAIYGKTEKECISLNLARENNEVVLDIGGRRKIDFRVRSDNNMLEIYDKSNIKKILCITRSIVMIDSAIKLLLKSQKIGNINIDIIISPPYRALNDFDSAMENAPTSLGDFINFKGYKIDTNTTDYCKRFFRLEFLIRKYLLNAKIYYLGNVVFLIVEFDEDNRKEILFSIRDSGSLKRRVGLYSKEPHIIKYFENLFYDIWYDDIPSFKKEFDEINSN